MSEAQMVPLKGILEHIACKRKELMHVDCFPGGMQFLSYAYFKMPPFIYLEHEYSGRPYLQGIALRSPGDA